MTQKTKEYREKIAEEFLNLLEEKQLDWKKEWEKMGRPMNAKSGHGYKGLNLFHLSLIAMERGYKDSRWATFKQIEEQGWRLKNAKGQGVKVEYWFMWDHKEGKAVTWEEYRKREPDKARYKLRARYSTVFNADLIQGIPAMPEPERRDINPDELVGRIAKNMEVEILNDGGYRAFYRPSEDKIHLPEPQYFYTDYAYNSTALHELSHASGAAHRLNRNMGYGFGTETYAFEELVAEISSCFVSVNLQMEQDQSHIDNHKAYVQSWVKAIREQPDTLVKAVQQAEEAANYLEYKAELIPEKEYKKKEEASMEIEEKGEARVSEKAEEEAARFGQRQKSGEGILEVLNDVQQKTMDIREDIAFFEDFMMEHNLPLPKKEPEREGKQEYYVIDDRKTGNTVRLPDGKELRISDPDTASELADRLNRKEEFKGRDVYTEKSEQRAKEPGLEERSPSAMFSKDPLQGGGAGQAWKEKRHVKEAAAPKL